MKIHAVTIHRPMDGQEVVSIHMTRKGALQSACEQTIETLNQYDSWDDSDTIWIQDNNLNYKGSNLTIKDLEGIFKYATQLLWQIECEVDIWEYTLQP